MDAFARPVAGLSGAWVSLAALPALGLTPNPPSPANDGAPLVRPHRGDAQSSRALVLLPTLNEREGLEHTLDELGSVDWPLDRPRPEFAIVDGRSTDGTAEVARRRGIRVLEQTGSGKGAAIRESLVWARREGFEYVALLDADATYPAHRVPALLTLLHGGADVVIGVRRPDHPSHSTARDLVHRVGNGVLNYLAAQMTRRPILDVCSGFWGLRSSVIDPLALESDGFEIESELFVKAFRGRLRVAQIPVEYRQRIGDAKLHAVRDGARIALSIARHALRPGSRLVGAMGRVVRSAPDPVGDLCSIIFGLSPARVVLLSSRHRWPEAREIDARLRLGTPGIDLTTEVLDRPFSHPAWSFVFPGEEGLELPSSPAAPLIVSLPDLSEEDATPGSVVLAVPRTNRVIHLAPTGGGDRAVAPAALGLPVGLHLEDSSARPLRALAILSATLDASWVLRERALVRANGSRSSVGVFQAGGRGGPWPTAARQRFAELRGLLGGQRS